MTRAPLAGWAAALLLGCVDAQVVGSDCIVDSGLCTSRSSRGGGTTGVRPPSPANNEDAGVLSRQGRISNVDLLLVLDSSASMSEERAAFAAQLPPLLSALMRGEIDGNGEREFMPVTDLRVAVVTSDLGAGSRSGTCSARGDDAALWLLPGGGSEQQGCAVAPQGFLQASDVAQAEDVADVLGCVLRAPSAGCRLEQPLAAALALLERERQAMTEIGRPVGADASASTGFLRPDSLVVILVVADEDDCSTASPGALLAGDASSTACATGADRLRATAALGASLRGVRDDAHDLIMLGAVTGVPVDRVDIGARIAHDMETSAGRAQFYEVLLADPRMASTSAEASALEVEGDRVGLRAACTHESLRAYPAPRLVEAARHFGAEGVVQSLCDPNGWQLVAHAIGRRLGSPER